MPPRYTDEELLAKALANIERNLGNVVLEDGEEVVEESAYNLAFDALWDAGVRGDRASRLAERACEEYKLYN